ncbi:MAG: hypothetical protein LBC35_06365 [Coriobacteriales bacterium]|jgi:hypothetical protein|nr:hypothetical protein [Coriobacteriales bacterium]
MMRHKQHQQDNGGEKPDDPVFDSAGHTYHAHFSSSRIDALQRAYREVFSSLKGDVTGRITAATYLNTSSAFYHDRVIGMGFLPKLYDEAALSYFDTIVATTYRILDKITQHYLRDDEYRRLFRFSPLLESLICLPSSYAATIPIARFDIFLDEQSGDFMFCEFNTDGSSAMNEDREVCNALATTPSLANFSATHRVCAQELFDNWIDAFLRIYESSSAARPNPTVAIVDYRRSATMTEHREFCRRFMARGVNCLIADIADLAFIDGALYATNTEPDTRDFDPADKDVASRHLESRQPIRVDAIYRRAVTHEIVAELEQELEQESQPTGQARRQIFERLLSGNSVCSDPSDCTGARALLVAVATGSVCMLGDFKTQVAHSKAVFVVLHLPETQAILSASERDFIRRHVPYTTWLDADSIDLNAAKANKDRWIIKPVDGYATMGVFAGRGLGAEEWERLIDEHSNDGYVIQEYCQQYATLNTLPLPLDSQGQPMFSRPNDIQRAVRAGRFDAQHLEPYHTLTGLFSYDGRFSGVYVRAGQDALIVGFRGGITLGSLLCDVSEFCDLAIVPRHLDVASSRLYECRNDYLPPASDASELK